MTIMSYAGDQVPVIGGQDKVVIEKLDGLFEWAKLEPRVGANILQHCFANIN